MVIKDSLVKWYLTWVFITYRLNNLVKWYLTRLFERLSKDVAKKNSYKTTSVNSSRLRVQRIAARLADARLFFTDILYKLPKPFEEMPVQHSQKSFRHMLIEHTLRRIRQAANRRSHHYFVHH